jgi:magnesium transporter
VIRTVIFDPQGRRVTETGPPMIRQCLAQPGHLLWLDLIQPSPEELAQVQQEFGLHPLAMEDVAKGRQRPKLDIYDDHYYLVCYALVHSQNPAEFEPSQLNIFVGHNFVVTIHACEIGILSETLRRWEQGSVRHEDGVGFLLYFLLDSVVDDYFPVLDAVDERIEELEQSLFTRFREESLREIFAIKRSLVSMRKVVAPLRDAIGQFARRDEPMFGPHTTVYFSDVYDHVIRVVDTLDTHRDMLTGTLEAYLSVLSNRLNEVMKKLTALATVVGGAGLILAAWGVNLDHLPFKEKPWGFAAVIGVTVLTTLLGLLVAWRERWL